MRGGRGASARYRWCDGGLRRSRLLGLDAVIPVWPLVGAFRARGRFQIQFVIAGGLVDGRADSHDMPPVRQPRADTAFCALRLFHEEGNRIAPCAVRPELDGPDEFKLLRHHIPSDRIRLTTGSGPPCVFW